MSNFLITALFLVAIALGVCAFVLTLYLLYFLLDSICNNTNDPLDKAITHAKELCNKSNNLKENKYDYKSINNTKPKKRYK